MMPSQRVATLFAFYLLLSVVPRADAYFYTIRSTSEENAPLECPDKHPVTGVLCAGRYCDNVQLECEGFVTSTERSVSTGLSEWLPYISEEAPNQAYCSMSETQKYYPGSPMLYGVMKGIACSGQYCDKVSMKCTLVNGNGPDLARCKWTPWMSEENGGMLLFDANMYAVGMQCAGQYCDNKRFYVCALKN